MLPGVIVNLAQDYDPVFIFVHVVITIVALLFFATVLLTLSIRLTSRNYVSR